MREGQSLIDRFYDGGNRAKPEALDILVMVLDQIVRRMRQQYSTRRRTIEDCEQAMAVIDAQIAMIRPKQAELRKELAAKQLVADEMRKDIEFGTTTIKDAIATAQKTLHNAKVVTRKCETKACLDKKQADKGYDKTGKPLPGAPARPTSRPPHTPRQPACRICTRDPTFHPARQRRALTFPCTSPLQAGRSTTGRSPTGRPRGRQATCSRTCISSRRVGSRRGVGEAAFAGGGVYERTQVFEGTLLYGATLRHASHRWSCAPPSPRPLLETLAMSHGTLVMRQRVCPCVCNFVRLYVPGSAIGRRRAGDAGPGCRRRRLLGDCAASVACVSRVPEDGPRSALLLE